MKVGVAGESLRKERPAVRLKLELCGHAGSSELGGRI